MTRAPESRPATHVELMCAADSHQMQAARLINPAFRIADREDIETLCTMRCAQSLEYWGKDPGFDSGAFRVATKTYLEENLGTRILFGVIEQGSEVVSISGLEMNDRLPAIGGTSGASFSAERSATIVSCYTPKEHRGNGYMGQMLDIWMSLATLFNVDALYLESHNPSMQHMAARGGYEQVSSKYKLSLEGGTSYAQTFGTSGRIELDT